MRTSAHFIGKFGNARHGAIVLRETCRNTAEGRTKGLCLLVVMGRIMLDIDDGHRCACLLGGLLNIISGNLIRVAVLKSGASMGAFPAGE